VLKSSQIVLKSRYFLLLAGSLALAVFCIAWPLFVIRPFHSQDPFALQTALFTVRFSWLGELAALVTVLAAIVRYWRVSKIPGVITALLVIACGAFSRVDIFEIMFHPVPAPAFQAASETTLDRDERVLAVKSRAYPIRSISYHHIVNDVVDSVPIAATY
jgi:hypothetical protein